MKKILLLSALLVLVFTGCGKDDKNGISVKQKEYTLNYEDKAQIEAISSLDITYTSESEYVAKVSVSGLITAGRVGKTSILLSNGESQTKVGIIVRPVYNLFPEPIEKISFGVSKQKVKEVFGAPDFENSTGILYDNYYLNYIYMFLFEGDKLASMAIAIPTLSIPDNFSKFMVERYAIINMAGYVAQFINERQDIGVVTGPTNDFSSLLVTYAYISPTNRSVNHMIPTAEEMQNALQALLSRE